jgi:DNA adenine methylase
MPRLAGEGDEPIQTLRAPFPWFGGKSRAADLIWPRFGDVANYVEPFAGSLAVLLARPTSAKVETVNDADAYLANFWRALQYDAETVAYYADSPVNEADLHARHLWLVHQDAFRERMKVDPEYFDTRIAGWWVWGQCLWIGSGWCDSADVPTKIPNLTGGFGEGVGLHRKLPHLSSEGVGLHRKLPHLSSEGVGRTESGPSRQAPSISTPGTGIHANGIHAYLSSLAVRLRRVRVCCGDWARVVTPAVTTGIGLTGVLLDPPYGGDHASDLYAGGDDRTLSAAVRAWALERGDDPDLRIALCGFEGEHDMPETWECVHWKARGGYGSQRQDGTNENRKRERIWFSPHCLSPAHRLNFEA